MPFGLGELPKEYNPKVHGPYYPWVYYGKKDTPFTQVKLGELPGWMARRSLNPIDWGRAVSRAGWRWKYNYMMPRNCGPTAFIQGAVAVMVGFFVYGHARHTEFNHYKHRW